MVCIFIFHCVTVQAENCDAKCGGGGGGVNKMHYGLCENGDWWFKVIVKSSMVGTELTPLLWI